MLGASITFKCRLGHLNTKHPTHQAHNTCRLPDRQPAPTEGPMATALRFVRRQHKAENATTFYFEPETPLAYQAGQYLNYTPPHPNPDNRGVTRSFTLSSFPEEPLLSLTTRLSTPRSTALAGLEPDAVLEANGPFGSFVCRQTDRKSTRLNSSHTVISYAVFCLKKKKNTSAIQAHTNFESRLLLEKKAIGRTIARATAYTL